MKKFALLMTYMALGFAGVHAAGEVWPWIDPQSEKTVNILLLGDINILQRSNPADAFVNVRDTLNSADLVYGNLEGLLVKSRGLDKDIPNKAGWQHIGPETVQALKSANIRVVGVANNVAYGPADILKSLAVLDSAGIAHTGAGPDIYAAHRPAIIEVKGLRVGFLQYTGKWYAQDQQIATPVRPGVARIMSKDGMTIEKSDLKLMREDIRSLRPLVDILVVSSHDRDGLGLPLPAEMTAESRQTTEGMAESDKADLFSPIHLGPQFSQTEAYQKTLAHEAIDAGADIVYGHGSHVLQGVEIYKGKPVMYCLGNFAMDWIRMRPNKDGLVARVVVENRRIKRVSLVPVTRDAQNNVQMLDPSSGEGEKLIQKVRSMSGNLPLKIEGKEAVLLDE